MFKKLKHKVIEKVKPNGFVFNVISDYDYRTTVFAVISFAVTVAFATANLVSGIVYRLVWYWAISLYYFLLVVFRGYIFAANRKYAKKYAGDAAQYEKCRWKIHLASGAFLFLIEFAMATAIMVMMLSERHMQSGEIMAIANAAYTFYKISIAIYNFVKAHRLDNPITQSLRNLNFADACMSVVSLTVLMISTFDPSSYEPLRHVQHIIGFAACAIIIAVATVMIVRAVKKLKTFDEEQ